jgi:hypothetical protein
MQKKMTRNKEFRTILRIRQGVGKSTAMQKFKPLSELLQIPDKVLGTLSARLRDRAELLVAVQTALPARLAAEVLSAGLEGGRLTVGVSSAAWAARLRYFTNDLRKTVGSTARTTIVSVRLRVVPASG